MSKYLTFPIAFLNAPTINIKDIIKKAFNYCLYERCYYEEIDPENVDEAEDYLGINFGDKQTSYWNGKRLFDELEGSPKTSISAPILWDFYKNEKTEEHVDCFLAFMAIRSILQKDACKKITNGYLLSRMAGHAKKGGQLPDRLKKYSNRYWMDKLKKELTLNWGVKMYGRYTRGTYMSFKMSQKDLTTFVELRRKKYREKKMAKENEAIRQQVLAEINNRSKTSANHYQINTTYK